ncbi:hypothetical protein L208DRAFT_1203446, partial [Tricholoma matsutake]
MMKIVNLLSAKMEMGSPMICMYLLGNPDHYTNYQFVLFYWHSFQADSCSKPSDSGTIDCDNQQSKKIVIFKRNNHVIGLSPVHNYVFQPHEYSSMCLYDWISLHQQEK